MPELQFRLLTLGRLALLGAEGDPAADALRRQRRKLTVLALLGLAHEPVSRAALAEMFWGEQPEERARHSLSEALSHLRRVLGHKALATRGPEVMLAPAAPLVVDAREFAAAVRAEQWGAALELWGGAFLEGVNALGSRRLEGWIEGQQRELGHLLEQACEHEYAGLRAAARWDDAAAVARRWLEADPLSETAALALLGALEAGDTTEADAHAYREYQLLRARLEREYGSEPGARVTARGAVLRERLEAGGVLDLAAIMAAPVAPAAAAPAPARLPTLDPARALPAAAVAPPAAPPARTPRRRVQLAAWSAGTLALVLIAGGLLFHAMRRPAAGSPTRVAVLPFGVSGPAEYAYLREGVVDLLSANLDGAGPFRAVDPQAVLKAVRGGRDAAGATRSARDVAQRVGAGSWVSGDVVAAGGRLRISAAMFRQQVRDQPVAEAMVEGSPADLFLLVDQLTSRLLAASGSEVSPLGRLAAGTTGSVAALKRYLEGESDYRRGLYVSAFEAFRAAADEDTAFALAHYRLAQAGQSAMPPGWIWDSTLVRSRRAADHADRLAPRARLLVQAYAAMSAGAFDEAEQAYRAVVRTWPEDVEAGRGLGGVLFATNPVRGRSVLESGPAYERVLGLEPDNLSALGHLLRIRLRERRSAAVDSLAARLDSLVHEPSSSYYRVLHAFADGREGERSRALAELRATGSDELVRVAANGVALYARDEAGAARILPLMIDPAVPREGQAQGHIWLADLEIAHGRWHAAEPHLAAADTLDPAQALEQRALLAALPFAPTDEVRARATESALARWDGERWPATTYPCMSVYNGLHGVIREYLLGLLALRRGDAAATNRRARALAGRGGTAVQREFGRGLGKSLDAHMAAATGNPDALARFDTARLRVHQGLLELQFGSQAYERWARAELLFRLGRWRQALPWYESLPELYIYQLVYEAPAELRQAQIHERLGDGRGARAHYGRFVELWRDADPELQPQVAAARARLRVLSD